MMMWFWMEANEKINSTLFSAILCFFLLSSSFILQVLYECVSFVQMMMAVTVHIDRWSYRIDPMKKKTTFAQWVACRYLANPLKKERNQQQFPELLPLLFAVICVHVFQINFAFTFFCMVFLFSPLCFFSQYYNAYLSLIFYLFIPNRV